MFHVKQLSRTKDKGNSTVSFFLRNICDGHGFYARWSERRGTQKIQQNQRIARRGSASIGPGAPIKTRGSRPPGRETRTQLRSWRTIAGGSRATDPGALGAQLGRCCAVRGPRIPGRYVWAMGGRPGRACITPVFRAIEQAKENPPGKPCRAGQIALRGALMPLQIPFCVKAGRAHASHCIAGKIPGRPFPFQISKRAGKTCGRARVPIRRANLGSRYQSTNHVQNI